MLFRSASPPRVVAAEDDEELRVSTVAAWGFLAAVLTGAATALTNGRALLVVAGAGCVVWIVAMPSWLSLGSVLVVRGLTDAAADVPIAAGLNAGALIGLLLIATAGALVLRRVREGADLHALVPASILLAAIVYWSAIGVLRHGFDESLLREFVRAASIVAVAVMAANADRTMKPSTWATALVLAALVPAILVVGEALTHWSAMVSGELRPRGTLSHPNAASILFGTVVPLAAWKWAYDGGGVRYGAAAVLLLVAILFTRSMGGLAEVVVALVAFGMLQSGRASVRTICAVGAVAVVAFFILDPLGISRVSELESTTLAVTDGSADNNSFEWRLVNWSLLIRASEDARTLGHGLGSTSEIITPLGHLPHSDPIRFLVETGIVGVTLLGIGYLVMMNRLLLLVRAGPHRSFTAAVLATTAGVSVHALVTHVSFNTAPMYVLAALIGWTLARAGEEPDVLDAGGVASTSDQPPVGTLVGTAG